MLHNRTVDDAAGIIDAGIDVANEHYKEIRVTEAKQMEDRTRREYRNRIKHIYRWWMETYPQYFEVGTRVLSEDERKDQEAFHHRNDRDIIYQGLDVTLVKAFLVVKKKKRVKDDGTAVFSSVSDLKKYDDAIKWGSARAGQPLPSSYYRQMEAFIQAYKKEYKSAQKDGQTDDQQADLIVASLCCYICNCAVRGRKSGRGLSEYNCKKCVTREIKRNFRS